jgi:hypothetical protein
MNPRFLIDLDESSRRIATGISERMFPKLPQISQWKGAGHTIGLPGNIRWWGMERIVRR